MNVFEHEKKTEEFYESVSTLIINDTIRKMKLADVKLLFLLYDNYKSNIDKINNIIKSNIKVVSIYYKLHDYSINQIGITPFMVIIGKAKSITEIKKYNKTNMYDYFALKLLEKLNKQIKVSKDIINSYEEEITKFRNIYGRLKDEPTVYESHGRIRF
jgi:hypothetical protein